MYSERAFNSSKAHSSIVTAAWLGMMLGLLVTKEDGQSRIEFQQAFMRSLPGLFGVIPGINILVGLVMLIGSIIGILNDAERRSFYDRIGKTRVVYKNKL